MTFYWYDYETFGSTVSIDRPAQFAGVRTNESLEEIDEPLVLYCRPAADYLPNPEACLIHGITPIRLLKEGLPESVFAHRILVELSVPGTCSVGYNAISFDHEITRFLLYRNLRDPYEWHWRDGNTRWDIIDLLRAAYALRPDGIRWPVREDGAPSFRLEHIASANGLDHDSPHEALTDVRTTIALARLIKARQPDLFNYYLRMRDKDEVARLLSGPCVLVSSFIAADRGCASLVAPLCEHPTNKNAVIVYDLRYDPSEYLDMRAEDLREALFGPGGGYAGERPPISRVKTNGCPFVAPPSVLDESVQTRLCLDRSECVRNYRKIKSSPAFAERVREAYERDFDNDHVDIDAALYAGEFVPDSDRDLLAAILSQDLSCGGAGDQEFSDDRMAELIFRYRARNYPDTLSDSERARWKDHCRARHTKPDVSGLTALDLYHRRVADLRREKAGEPADLLLLDELEEYERKLRRWMS